MKSNYLIILIILISVSAFAENKHVTVNDLRCEYKKNPLGIESPDPRLSWKIYSGEMNQVQTAYQILVASSPQLLSPDKADLWNSEKVFSDQSIQVKYSGKPLVSRQQCFWVVKIWDKDGKETKWSSPGYFEMGLLEPTDWKAEWIKTAFILNENTCLPLFRKEFNITKKIKSGRLYCTSHGLYEFYLNGEKVGDELFTPGWTSFEKRLQYQVYDITGMLNDGVNAAGIMLGNGWWNGWSRLFKIEPGQEQKNKDFEVLAQIEVEFTDGTKQLIKTDDTWKSSTGAIVKSEIYDGEIYDARLEKNGWNTPGYDDRLWEKVVVTDTKKDHLVSRFSPPIRKIQEIKPIEVIYTPNGDTVFDMGQNMIGWCRLKITCPEGTVIKLRHGEVLDQNGNLYTANLSLAKQEITYVCKGGQQEVYEPHFTYQGFRYVSISGYPKEVAKDILKGVVIHSDLERSGTFSCNDSLINQLQHNIVWGQKGNFFGVPTDCPQRNERLGWTGDAVPFAPTACFNMQCGPFFINWLRDFVSDQREDGAVPNIVPDVVGRFGSHGWADAAVIIPWIIYHYYGDIRVLEDQYDCMKRWVEFLQMRAGEQNIRKYKYWGYKEPEWQWGEWMEVATTGRDFPGPVTDKEFIATAYYYRSVNLFRQIAEILGKTDDALYYKSLEEKIRIAFCKEFVTANGRLTSNTQTAYVLALSFGLLPPEYEESAAARLAESVNQLGHLTTGLLGTADICFMLSKYGYLNEAYKLLYNKEYPSWLYPITRGATTMWERWDGIKTDGTFQKHGNSFNHYFFGAIGNWLYSVVAGINADSIVPAYKRIIIHPQPGGLMNNVKARYESPYGAITSEWIVINGRMYLTVEIPPNTTSEVYIPSTRKSFIVNGKKKVPVETVVTKGLPYYFLKTEVGSGRYVFDTEFNTFK